MLHRIRLAMKAGSIMTSHGQFEADETLIGGRYENMHADKRAKAPEATGRGTGKAVVDGHHQSVAIMTAAGSQPFYPQSLAFV